MKVDRRPLMVPQPGRYRHFAGTTYDVIGTAQHADATSVLVVVYRPVDSAATRLLWMTLEDWMGVAYVNGWRTPRFTRVDAPPAEREKEEWP